MIKDNFTMLKGFVEEFQATGTLFQSSHWAAKALTNPLREAPGPRSILEVGAGTGPVTEKIIADMNDKDTLTICELNPKFMSVLKDKLLKNSDYIRNQSRITFFEGYIQDLPETTKYDIIVCALPFLNFSLEVVEDIFNKFHRLSADAAVMTWYEYVGLRSLGKVVSPPERKKRLLKLDRFFKDIVTKDTCARERVWLNVLPINIYTIKMAEQHASMAA